MVPSVVIFSLLDAEFIPTNCAFASIVRGPVLGVFHFISYDNESFLRFFVWIEKHVAWVKFALASLSLSNEAQFLQCKVQVVIIRQQARATVLKDVFCLLSNFFQVLGNFEKLISIA